MSRKQIAMVGLKFGRLLVQEWASNRRGLIHFFCLCDCGEICEVAGIQLRRGKTKSCGCLRRDLGVLRGKGSRKHGGWVGGKPAPEYSAWDSMKGRCLNSDHEQFPNYGGRGITVCDRWVDSFENFLDDMGPRPTDVRRSLDRIDNDGNYCPGNCRWATSFEQNNNTRRCRFLDIKGQSKTIAQWAREPDSSSLATIHRRLKAGKSPEEAVFGRRYGPRKQK